MPTILIIDDDDDVRDILSRTLAKHGYAAIVARNGNEGLEVYRQHHPDLVVTDIFMPEKEGFETIRELRAEFPEVKIIVMSGGGRSALGDADMYLDSAQTFGASYSFRKPVPRKDFLEAVRSLVGPGAETDAARH